MLASSRHLPRWPNLTLAGGGSRKVNSSATYAQPTANL
jgi:hypothetical protein